jgi:uncharacterized membrane protein YgcG
MKRGTLPFAIAISTSIVGCDTTGPVASTTHRDVYHSLEDCVADWGDVELCEQQMKEAREHAEKLAAAHAQQSGSTVIPTIVPMFFGPEYIGTSRTHTTPAGQTYVAKANNSERVATYVTNPATNTRTISYSPGGKTSGIRSSLPTYTVGAPNRPAGGSGASTSSTARGGFSSSGRGFSSSSGGG